MKFIRSLPIRISPSGNHCAMAVFWCEYCEQEVERARSRGMTQDSCGCIKRIKNRKIKKVEVVCLKCDGKFQSVNKSTNRLCIRCKLINKHGENKDIDLRAPHKERLFVGHRHKPIWG